MKISHIITIILISSLVLFIPLMRQETEYGLIPEQEKTVIVNIQNSKLIVSSNRPSVELNMIFIYMNPETNSEDILDNNIVILGKEKVIDIDTRGFYKLKLFSRGLITVTIKTEGIPETTIFIVSLALILTITVQIQKQFSRSFDY